MGRLSLDFTNSQLAPCWTRPCGPDKVTCSGGDFTCRSSTTQLILKWVEEVSITWPAHLTEQPPRQPAESPSLLLRGLGDTSYRGMKL